MSDSFYFEQVEENHKNSEFLDLLENYANQYKQQVYVIDKPLSDSKYTYDYKDALVLLIPKHQILLLDYGNNSEEFSEFFEDFVEDLGSISDKYLYRKIIGRPREWRSDLIARNSITSSEIDIAQFLASYLINDDWNKKRCELLISLLTGSINDIEKVKDTVPNNILDKVKQKILLFDANQTKFVYQNLDQSRITIQGLSGTGKTELLLHKLKEIYVEDKGSRVMFTCHNRILADSLRGRIPGFFNFMKVEEQILWNERLWCVHAWGSRRDKDSGAYRYICGFYDLQYHTYNPSMDFETVCKLAIAELNDSHIEAYGYAFDYMLIDESQDFPESFFELCEKITQNNIYVAGDIFQSIFDDNLISEINPDFLLSKCYRTDPRTLMFAHAIGMGLFESPMLRWLEDNEWNKCGYMVEKENGKFILTRDPLRRFEDLENENYSSMEIVKTTQDLGEDAETKIIEIIRIILDDNPTVLAEDIGIIFIDESKNTYLSADQLEYSIPREFDWEVNKAFETKEKIKNTLFVSNKNNVKGLEFPFVICVTKKIKNSRSYRNALYMMLTRSFLKTYLLISEDSNKELAPILEEGLNHINTSGNLSIVEPTSEEKEAIRMTITAPDEGISHYDFVHKIFDELDVIPIHRPKIYEALKATLSDSFDYDDVKETVELLSEKMGGNVI